MNPWSGQNIIEIWKPLPEFEHKYEISTFGNVRHLKFKQNRKFTYYIGYAQVTLRAKGYKQKVIRVHRYVAKAFIPNPRNLNEINHIDGNPSNNNVVNLEWCTHSENIQHSFDLGLQIPLKGEKVFGVKLTETDVREIRNLYIKGTGRINRGNGYIIIKKYGIDQTTLSNIINRDTWKHI